jgi:hypothetical protein
MACAHECEAVVRGVCAWCACGTCEYRPWFVLILVTFIEFSKRRSKLRTRPIQSYGVQSPCSYDLHSGLSASTADAGKSTRKRSNRCTSLRASWRLFSPPL